MAGVDFRRRTLLKGSMASMLSPIVLSGCSGGGAHANVLTDGEAGQAQDSVSLQQAGYFRGTPYFVTQFDGRLWIPEITEYSALRSYPASGDAVTAESAQTLFDFGLPDEASLERKRAIVT